MRHFLLRSTAQSFDAPLKQFGIKWQLLPLLLLNHEALKGLGNPVLLAGTYDEQMLFQELSGMLIAIGARVFNVPCKDVFNLWLKEQFLTGLDNLLSRNPIL